MSHRRALVLGSSLISLLVSLVSSRAFAQAIPNALTGLEITPDGGTMTVNAGSTGNQIEFMAHNGLNTPATYSFACSGTKFKAACASVSPTSATIPVGGSREVLVTFNGLAAGMGKITLTANPVGETGFVNVTVVGTGVAVTPDGGAASPKPVSTTGYSETFSLHNTGSATNTFTLACTSSSNITCTGTSVNGVSVSAIAVLGGATIPVVVSYSVGAAGSGTLTLSASAPGVSDAGSFTVPVVTPTPQAPLVATDSVNPGPTVERSSCLSLSLGQSAASECGDLRLVHALPSTRTLTRERTPVLLYNSQFAHPFPVVASVVTLPLISSIPDSVTATATIGGVLKGRGKWLGNEWQPAQARRVVVAFDALSLASGIYSCTLEVRTWFGTNSMPASVVVPLAIVNRSSSPFGAGWWLAGLEELNVGTKVWTGGDGSVRQYQPVTGQANMWAAASFAHPDTLKWDGSQYTRFDKAGLRVRFDATGKHVATINRQGHTTTFTYASGRLTAITLPTFTLVRTYDFAYDLAAGRLSSVAAPRITPTLLRVTTFTGSNGQITSITEPDGSVVRFGYHATFANWLVSRTDRLGAVTTFGFDTGNRVSQSSLAMGGTTPPIVIGVKSLESRGLPGTGSPSSVDTSRAYARSDGPRTDVPDTTLFWQDRFGSPRKIVDATGSVTTITRGDLRWPGLVTRIVHANGWKEEATYDARGNVASTTDFGFTGNPVTTFEWDQKWDALKKVKRPEGDSVVMAYDAVTGNRMWRQDGRGSATRVTFGYDAVSRLESVTRPNTAPETLTYDETLGNLRSVTSPKGLDTKFSYNVIGRLILEATRLDTLVAGPPEAAVYAERSIDYDVMGRDTLTIAAGPQMSLTVLPETLYVRKVYDRNGQLLSLSRWASPDRASVDTIRTVWRYDAAGRQIAEVAPDGLKDSTTYDPAGNAILVRTRRNGTIGATYDALNRLSTRTLSAVNYATRPSNLVSTPQQANYPAYVIPGETQTFTYDPLGRLLTANNPDAKVTRSYRPNGWLDIEILAIRTVAGQDFTSHTYVSHNSYDRNGRRIQLILPAQLGSSSSNLGIEFGYHAQLGRLQTITDAENNPYTLSYNNRGELATIAYPSQYAESFSYDADGRMAGDTIRNLGGTAFPRLQGSLVRAETFAYDGRDKLLRRADPNGFQDTLSLSYSGLGYLVSSKLTERAQQLVGTDWFAARFASAESFQFDGLGNRYFGVTYDTTAGAAGGTGFATHASTYGPGTGRLLGDASTTTSTTYTYDAAGNIAFSSNPGVFNGAPPEERAMFYAADGTLRAVDWRWIAVPQSVVVTKKYAFDQYRYDALGRRILVRSQKTCGPTSDMGNRPWELTECTTSLVRRIIWDGSQELAEIQMPGDSTQANEIALFENDAAPVQLPNRTTGFGTVDRNQFYGRVIYTPGLAVDQPLSVIRINYAYQHNDNYGAVAPTVLPALTVVPFWDSKGVAPIGVFSTGAWRVCSPPTVSPGNCVSPVWSYFWSAFDHRKGAVTDNWFGSLLENKRDKTGLEYKRHRYYDPATGQFTQEDPIGLAGGINLYGFANGDPVNYSDPFGLCPPCSDRDEALQSAGLLDPTLYIGGLFGGLRGIGARLFGRAVAGAAIADATATVGARTLAGEIAESMGGAVSELAKSEGFKVTLQVGKRAVVARIAESGAYRVSISGLGSLTREGIISSEQALTHHAGANAADIVRLMKAARELLNVAKP